MACMLMICRPTEDYFISCNVVMNLDNDVNDNFTNWLLSNLGNDSGLYRNHAYSSKIRYSLKWVQLRS